MSGVNENGTLSTGTYWIEAPCPRCGQIEHVGIALSTVLTTPQDATASLKVKSSSKGVDHDCGQNRLRAKVNVVPPVPTDDESEPE